MTNNKESRDKKRKKLEVYATLARPAMNSLEAIKLDICSILKQEYVTAEAMTEKDVCNIHDAKKIVHNRTDLLTIDLLLKVYSNFDSEFDTEAFRARTVARIGLPNLRKFNPNPDQFDDDAFISVMTFERLFSILDIMAIIEGKSDDIITKEILKAS